MGATFFFSRQSNLYFKLFLISEVSLHQFSTAFLGGASLAPHTLHAPHPSLILYRARHTHSRPRTLPTSPTGLGLLFYSTVTAALPKIPHCNCPKSVPNRPLGGRRGRFGTLLQQLECGIFGRTAVACHVVVAQV